MDLPPRKEPSIPTSLRIPRDLLSELEAIAKESRNTRTALMVHFLRRAVQEYRAKKHPGTKT